MKTIVSILVSLILSTVISNAQTTQAVINRLQQPSSKGSITIQTDNISASALQRRQKKPAVNGFRINILNSTSQQARAEANAAITKLKETLPQINAKWFYDAPVFKVICGAWETRADATVALVQIKALFPAAFIINDKIEITEIMGKTDPETENEL